jgi:hypothetical protein
VRWGWQTLNTPDKTFHPLVEELAGQTIVLADLGFRDQDGIPDNLKLCPKGTIVCHLKKMSHRLADYIQARLAFVAAMFNVLLDLFHHLHPQADSFHMSIAEFSL